MTVAIAALVAFVLSSTISAGLVKRLGPGVALLLSIPLGLVIGVGCAAIAVAIQQDVQP